MITRTTVILRGLLLMVGATLLFIIIRRIGLATIADNVVEVGWRFFPVLILSFSWLCLYTLAWRQFIRKVEPSIGFWTLFKIKISGEAVNAMTPLGFIGGDPLRIYLLKQRLPIPQGAASVVVDRTLHTMATLFVVIFGIIVSFLTLKTLPANIKYGIPIVIMIALGFISFIFVHQRRGIFGLLLSTCRRLKIRREFSEKTVARFEELDAHIIDFYQSNQRGFVMALAAHTFGRLLGVLEIYLIGLAADKQFPLLAALLLCALAPIINVIFAFIPGALGIMEGAYGTALYLLHLDPAVGITIQIAKRIRAAFWIAIGLCCVGAGERKKVLEEKLIDEI